jgi:hypothetical protein
MLPESERLYTEAIRDEAARDFTFTTSGQSHQNHHHQITVQIIVVPFPDVQNIRQNKIKSRLKRLLNS